MARFRNSLRPIHRIKHVVDAQSAIPVNVQIDVAIAVAKDAPVLGTASDVQTGCSINAFFISTELVATEVGTGKTPNFYWSLYKNPGNNLSMPNGNAVGSNDNKRFFIHQEMIMFNPVAAGGTPRSVFKGVIKVPKGMRRMGPDDRWKIQLFIPSTGVTVNSCTQVHYKEFR